MDRMGRRVRRGRCLRSRRSRCRDGRRRGAGNCRRGAEDYCRGCGCHIRGCIATGIAEEQEREQHEQQGHGDSDERGDQDGVGTLSSGRLVLHRGIARKGAETLRQDVPQGHKGDVRTETNFCQSVVSVGISLDRVTKRLPRDRSRCTPRRERGVHRFSAERRAILIGVLDDGKRAGEISPVADLDKIIDAAFASVQTG